MPILFAAHTPWRDIKCVDIEVEWKAERKLGKAVGWDTADKGTDHVRRTLILFMVIGPYHEQYTLTTAATV